jgi:MFS transporter, PPP family, 3-phenylpropionic acid transporter
LNKKIAVVVSLFYFFYFAGMGLWVIFAPKILHTLGYCEFDIGVVFAVAPLVRFFSPFLFIHSGTITKQQFIASAVMTFVCTLFFGLTVDTFWIFILNILIFSFFWVVILPYADSIALENIPSKSYGFIRLFGSIGFMLIGIVIGDHASSTALVYTLYIVFSVLTVLFCFLLSRFDSGTSHEQSQLEISTFNPRPHWRIWVSMFFLQFSFGAFYNFFTIYETSHGISLSMTTYLWAFGVLCEIVMFVVQGRFIDRIEPFMIIKYTTLATVARWLLLYIFPDSLISSFVSQAFHALNFALYTMAVFLYLARTYPNNKKLAQMFFYGISYGLGGFLGALFAGATYGDSLYLYSAIFAFFGFAVLYTPRFRSSSYSMF